MDREAKEKEELIRKMKFDSKTQDDENQRLREEINLYKGRCANLQRDIELSSVCVNKLNND